ncbi:hypothetical protein QVA73_08070 [Staphylococcus chromogenes]|uniref:hypothetical protein n=1 Tax=Staphylococcus chromogenes TaxID=46126 RepID=UPI00290245B6|nr:hypothetical protein [Staphylococcus chromogenes]MDU0476849.1 hypothetical protein [Staphylococcus chromogenes]
MSDKISTLQEFKDEYLNSLFFAKDLTLSYAYPNASCYDDMHTLHSMIEDIIRDLEKVEEDSEKKSYKEFKDYDIYSPYSEELTAWEQFNKHVAEFPNTKIIGYSVGVFQALCNKERTYILVEYSEEDE